MSTPFDIRTFDERITKVVDYAFGGWHHVNYQKHGVSASNPWCKFSVYSGSLSTYDYDRLTRLVLAAHKWSVRAEIVQSGPRLLGIWLHCRVPDNGTKEQNWSEKHPTIGQLIQQAAELEDRI